MGYLVPGLLWCACEIFRVSHVHNIQILNTEDYHFDNSNKTVDKLPDEVRVLCIAVSAEFVEDDR